MGFRVRGKPGPLGFNPSSRVGSEAGVGPEHGDLPSAPGIRAPAARARSGGTRRAELSGGRCGPAEDAHTLVRESGTSQGAQTARRQVGRRCPGLGVSQEGCRHGVG